MRNEAGTAMAGRMLVLVALGELLGMTVWFSATAAAPSIAQEFNLDPAARAWLTMAVQAGFVAGTLITATTNIADLINPRRLFLIGGLVAACVNGALAFAPTATAIIALRFCTGMALAWVYPPGLKIAAGWFLERRGAALGFVVGALTFGSALPHLLAWLGSGLAWRSVVDLASISAAAGALLVGFGVADGPYVTTSAPFDRHALRIVWRRRGARLATLGYLGHMWEVYAMWTWIAAFAANGLAGHAGTTDGSLIAFTTIASGAIGCAAAGNWADAWGKPRIAGTAMVISASCALISPWFFQASLASLIAFTAVWGFTVVADSAQFSALVVEHSPRTLVGTALTLQISAGFLLTMVSMRLVPVVAARVGWRWAFVILVPGPAFGAWAMKRLSVPGP